MYNKTLSYEFRFGLIVYQIERSTTLKKEVFVQNFSQRQQISYALKKFVQNLTVLEQNAKKRY